MMRSNKLLSSGALLLALAGPGCEKPEEYKYVPYHKKDLKTTGEPRQMGLGCRNLYIHDIQPSEVTPDLHIYGNHAGGIGNTLQVVADPDNCIHMEWQYDSLMRICLRRGWTGKTDRGVRLGWKIEDFVKAYPDAMNRISRSAYFKEPATFMTTGHLKARFDNGLLTMLELGKEDFGDDKPTDPVWPIGPAHGPDPWWILSSRLYLFIEDIQDGNVIGREIFELMPTQEGHYIVK